MTTTNGETRAPRRKPRAIEFSILYGWHAVLSGAFIVAYLSSDEDTYAMHQFAGYLVLAAIIVRLVAALVAPAGSPLRLPRPDISQLRGWFSRVGGGGVRALPRRPLLALMAVVLLIGIGATAGSGAVADFVAPIGDIHEALGELALWLVIAHVVLVVMLHGVGRWWRSVRAAIFTTCAERGRS